MSCIPLPCLLRRALAALVHPARVLVACVPALAGAVHAATIDPPPGCEVFWQLTLQFADLARPVQVSLRVAGQEQLLQPLRPRTDEPGLHIGREHLFATGSALLPLPAALAARPSLQMCLRVDGLAPGQRLISSQHGDVGDERLLRWQGPPALLRELVLAAGALQAESRQAAGLALLVIGPDSGGPARTDAPDLAALADQAATTITAQRRYWGAAEAGRLLVLLQPDDGGAPPSTLARHGALLLRAPAGMLAAVPAFTLQLGRTHMRGWFREAFGPSAYERQPDAAPGRWFVEGLPLFYALRLRAAEGGAALDEFAAALSMLWREAGPNASGPWLALHWHSALHARGRGGLETVLRPLRVPAAEAWPLGPLSKPLAPHRLQAALRPLLADAVGADLQRLAGGLAPVSLSPESLGPCFAADPASRQVRVADGAHQSAACRAWLDGSTGAVAAAAPARPPAGARRHTARKPAAGVRRAGSRKR